MSKQRGKDRCETREQPATGKTAIYQNMVQQVTYSRSHRYVATTWYFLVYFFFIFYYYYFLLNINSATTLLLDANK